MKRHTRLGFSHNSIKSYAFELVNIDIWHTYQVKTLTDYNQLLTIVYDFGWFTWLHLIKYKCNSVKVVVDFFYYIETQLKTKVVIVRSDNTIELSGGVVVVLFQQKKILYQTSCSEIA